MAHTMESALAEAEGLPEADHCDAAKVAAALAAGAVRGARGNSGVVLSQVLRGIATTATSGDLDGGDFRSALNVALEMVLRAIAEPVDGTVVTVLRATVAAVNDAPANSLGEIAAVATSAARQALYKTPSQLEVLREAGVVDAGGQGLVVLLDALFDEIHGQHAVPADYSAVKGHGAVAELEVMFFITGADLDALSTELEPLGNSLLIARETESSGQVHIHSSRAGEVIERGFAAGEVSQLRIEVLPPADTVPQAKRLILAIAPAGPIAQLYAEAGATVLSPGEEDIVSRIVATVRSAGVDEVILLPNGLLAYGELVNAELASHAIDASMNILPTARLVSGIAALAVHDAAQPLAADTYAMAEAAGSMRTAELARSGDDVVVTAGADIVLIAADIQSAVERAVTRLLHNGGELVTLLVTYEAERELDVEKLRETLEDRKNVEIMVYPAEGIDKLVEIGVE